jgi:AraC-like DNA-binding protein/mannose-6-phosphate isomerase-like protein (cupin superfamily)
MLNQALIDAVKEINYVHTYKTQKSLRLNGTDTSPSHCHDLYEIYYFVSGKVDYFIENKVYEMEPGDLFIIRSDEFHSFRIKSQDTYEKISLRFPPELAKALSEFGTDLLYCFDQRLRGEKNKLDLTPETRGQVVILFDKFESLKEVEQENLSVLKLSYLVELLVLVNQAFMNNIKYTFQDSKVSEKLRPVLDYIDANLDNNLSINLLSEKFYISTTNICTAFKNTTGVSIHKYIIFKRISKAKELLKKGYNVSDCCSACGFNDYAHFIRAFKTHTGLPPGKYKKGS